ncbi:glycosyltransferase [Aurantimonas sp. Leaf443]|uniref:glycosyltransferase n=1 Tax=Aurantimonas sp. Leaf443 TaxID=1736378 RepID=UPI0006F72075|nr:glycosyltransferase [Aurantimonas sp. Leaf443]KQT85129.1 hypothetical protein ASG48_07570 [Aurantimonas sp. Leaf443]
MTASPPRTVVLFSTADWNAPYWTNKQHIARRLARRGARVLYVESVGFRRPRVSGRDLSRIADRLVGASRPPREVEENLWVFSPLTIPFAHGNRAVRAVNAGLLLHRIRRWLKRHGRGAPTIWTYHPYLEDVLPKLGFDRLVYHCVDDIAAVPGVDATLYRTAEDRLLRRADLVFTTSLPLQDRCAAMAGARSVYERNVADIEHFAAARRPGSQPETLAAIPHPRIGYVGVLSDYKLDLGLLETCIAARPDWHWVFIGDEPEGYASPAIARMKRLPNAHFLGYRPYDALPDHLRAMDVGMLPNLLTGYAASVFPMKLYEYLAAGLPVLATPMPALREMDGTILVGRTPEDWIAAVETIISHPVPPLDLDDERLAAFSWDARLDRMLDRLASLDNPVQPPPTIVN